LIIFSTGSLYLYGLNRAFELAKEAGFDGLEVLVDERWDTRQADYLSKLSIENEMPICVLHNPFDSKRYIDGWEIDTVSRLERTVEMAEILGASTVVLHLPYYYKISLARWMKTELPAYQQDTAIKIAVENMPHVRLIFGPLALMFRQLRRHDVKLNRFWKFATKPISVPGIRLNKVEILERFQYLTFDTTHFATGGFDVLGAYERLKDKIAHVHLSNYNLERHQEHCLPMDGILPLDELLQRLKRDNYQNTVCLEVNPTALEAEREEDVLENMKKSLDFCRLHFAPDNADL